MEGGRCRKGGFSTLKLSWRTMHLLLNLADPAAQHSTTLKKYLLATQRQLEGGHATSAASAYYRIPAVYH
jgi:hypothetical protein